MIVFNDDNGAVLQVRQDNPPIIQLAADTTLNLNNRFPRGLSFARPAGLSALDVDWYDAWDCNIACTVTSVLGKRRSGTGATVNARRLRSGTPSTFLASDLSLTTTTDWIDGGAVQNTDLLPGDIFQIGLMSVSGLPVQVAVQVNIVS